MKKLDGFTSDIRIDKIYPCFISGGITKHWLFLLRHGRTKIYDNGYGIINIYEHDGITYINSGSIKDGRFIIDMLKDLKRIVSGDEPMVVMSMVEGIASHMKKYGFKYNKEKYCYERNAQWE